MALEPLHPAQDRGDPSARPDGTHVLQDECGHPVGIPSSLGVVESSFWHVVGLVPGGRPGVQLGDLVRVFHTKLGVKVIAQEVVIAVPLAVSVEGKNEHVLARQVLERTGGAGHPRHGIAQWAREPVQDRRAHEQVRLIDLDAGQQLGAEVVAHPPVISSEGHVPDGFAGLHGERGEVHADGPTFGSLHQVIDPARRRLDARAHEQSLCFGRGHGQLPRSELQDVPLSTQPGRLDRQALARGQGQLPADGNSHRELGQRGMAAVVRDVFEVVEHDGHGCADRLDRGNEGGDDRDAAPARRQQSRWALGPSPRPR